MEVAVVVNDETIESRIARRADISPFLVHLTRSKLRDGRCWASKDRLKNILKEGQLRAESAFGLAKHALENKGLDTSSQACVCFTEAPLDQLHLFLGCIPGRKCWFEGHGVAIIAAYGRKHGVNPVWYVDQTPGHRWLSNDISALVNQEGFAASPLARLTPFFEAMGSGATEDGDDYRKEFSWEREWHHVGNFKLPEDVIVFAPEKDHDEMRGAPTSSSLTVRAILDLTWASANPGDAKRIAFESGVARLRG